MRELNVRLSVIPDIPWLGGSVVGWAYVKQPAPVVLGFFRFRINKLFRIRYLRDSKTTSFNCRFLFRVARLNIHRTQELDVHAKIDLALLDRVCDLTEFKICIRRAVAENDETAAPQNHFVEGEIFEMTTIGHH